MNVVKIFQARTPAQIDEVRLLFREYETSLDLDLCFQGFEEELKNLPGKYAEPDGRLYLATIDDEAAGCIALRDLGGSICEMKRLYLRENARGKGLGNSLIEKLIAEARVICYRKMRLDTSPPKMVKAVKLYESHGFHQIPPYYDNPHDGVLFMELSL